MFFSGGGFIPGEREIVVPRTILELAKEVGFGYTHVGGRGQKRVVFPRLSMPGPARCEAED